MFQSENYNNRNNVLLALSGEFKIDNRKISKDVIGLNIEKYKIEKVLAHFNVAKPDYGEEAAHNVEHRCHVGSRRSIRHRTRIEHRSNEHDKRKGKACAYEIGQVFIRAAEEHRNNGGGNRENIRRNGDEPDLAHAEAAAKLIRRDKRKQAHDTDKCIFSYFVP